MIINLSERATNNLYLVKVELVYAKTSQRKSITIIGLSFVFFYVSIHFIQLSLQPCHWGTALKRNILLMILLYSIFLLNIIIIVYLDCFHEISLRLE